MKHVTHSLALAAVLTLFSAGSASAQSIGSIGDYYNDYEVHVAEWQTNWYVIVTWDDGTVTEYRTYSEQGAKGWAIWLLLHVVEVHDVDVVSRAELSNWVYIDTFGTYSLAVAEATAWQADGYETDIRAIRVNGWWTISYLSLTSKTLLTK